MGRDLGKYSIPCNIAVVGSFDTDRIGSSGELATPGLSDSTPLRRPGVPRDMANCVRLSVGPCATCISGQSGHLNGAYSSLTN